MFKDMKALPKGDLVEYAGAMVRNRGDQLNVMNLRPPCLRMLGLVKYRDGVFVAERYDSGLGTIAESSRHGSARAAVRYLVQADKAS
jgi:hypothetical protein